ncbi:MAG: lipid IV(A) 3-deoxy-D-manno-octulosonic acid transferase [Rhodocyclaceae bacterium]|nr:lipid IV(A) 3-deoxy-D-manno-octulosonic acid transferase [Rhodocyclaceae bacterium]
MWRALYTFLWLLVLPLAVSRLLWRGRSEPGYRADIGERLGRYRDVAHFQGAWWIHAVSVGEIRASEPIVRALLARDEHALVLLTQMTPTGRRTALELFAAVPSRVRVAYLPYDLPWLVGAFMRRFRPRAAILMETEIWPNLLQQAKKEGIPTILANARLSRKSADRYALLGPFARDTFGCLGAVAAQSEADARRLEHLGAPPATVTGSVKFDVQVPDSAATLAAHFQRLIGSRRVILAASTRDGEESGILDAFLARATEDDLLVVVPRHPQRFDAVAALIEARGARLQRRSSDQAVAMETRAWLGDSMGEMFAYFCAAQVTLIGGSWKPLGGQNLIEACAVGTPVIVGPHTFNFDEITRLAITSGAAIRAPDVAAGFEAAIELLGDAGRREAMSAAGRQFAAQHRGATLRTLAVLDATLAGNG